ncbi:MAG: hypothetical protein GX094_09930 [Clostridiales bacterium]|jgi:hypothetical protein|nr:hypothetical protein [Clostridiales bacterium]
MRGKNIVDSQDDVLLDLIHIALLNWKKADMLSDANKKPLLGKGIYTCLLREAKKKGLYLNHRQLLERILYPHI